MKKILLIASFLIFNVILTKNIFAYTGLPFTYSGYSNSRKINNEIKASKLDIKIAKYLGNNFVNKHQYQIGFGFYVFKNYNTDICDMLVNIYHLTHNGNLDANITYSMYDTGMDCDLYGIDYHLKKDAIYILTHKDELLNLFAKMTKQESK